MTINEITWDIPEIPVHSQLEREIKQIVYDQSQQNANNAASYGKLETFQGPSSQYLPYLPEQKANIPKSFIHPELDELAHRFLGPSFENEPDSLADMVISPLSPEPSTSINMDDPFQNVSPVSIINHWDHRLCLTDSSEDFIPDSNECSSWSSESSLCSLTATTFAGQSTSANLISTQNESNLIDNAPVNISGAGSNTSGGEIRKRKRKGLADPNEWKKNRRKIRRQSGEPYLSSTGRMIPGKRLTEGRCKGLCREKCTQHFTEDERQTIFSAFWSIESLEQKRQFIVSLIQREEPRTRRTSNTESKRKYTNRYFMKKPNSTEPKRVCQKFFLSTFNISETFVRFCFKKITQNSEVMFGTTQPKEFG